MLQNIRDRVTGWVAAVIFTALIIPFALWGVNSYFEGGGEVIALEVNGEEISLRDYRQSYQLIRQRWQDVSKQPISAQIEPLLKEQAVTRLIQSELFKQYGDKMGLSVSDADVLDSLKQIPQFNDGNGFSPGLFEFYANSRGLTAAAFQLQLKQDMAIEQFQASFFESSFATAAEANMFAKLKNEKRDLEYAVLASDKLKASLEVTEDEINTYYQENPRLFVEAEKVKLEYVVLSANKIAEGITLEDGELETWFADNNKNYEVAEQRHIKQVLVKLPEEAGEELTNAMQGKANELLELIKAGTSLETVVTENTKEGEDNNIEFSEFEFLSKEVMEPEVDELVFQLEEGKVSEPIRSKYGFHIVEVVKVKGGASAILDDIREQVMQDLKLSKAETELYEAAENLSTLAFEHPDTLTIAAEELGLDIQQSDYMSRNNAGAGIVGDPTALQAAFSDEVLVEGNNSELLEVANERLMVLRVADHIEEQINPLETVREQIVTRIKFEQAKKMTEEKGQAIIARLDEGTAVADLAPDDDLVWKQANGVKRDDPNVNRAVLRQGFNAGKPAGGKTRVSGTSLGSGDYVVVIVSHVYEGSEDEMKKVEIKTLREQLVRTNAATDWQEFTKELRRVADVTIYEDVF